MFPDTTPDDEGNVRLKVEVANAGHSPRIHYQEDAEVTTQSPVLTENVLVTNALRVQFIAVDPTEKNQTGTPKTWINELVIRNRFDAVARQVELFVAPKGTIRYTLDGSEARNGIEYTGVIDIDNKATTIYVFAECEGLEAKRNFTFAESGSTEVILIKDKPAQWVSATPKRLDNASKTYEGLAFAKEKNISFEQVTLIIGSAPKVIYLTLGEMTIDAEFIEKALSHLQTLVAPEAPLVMQFKKANTATGHDLAQFAKLLGIELINDEVIQG